jgi:hypothetical protein
MDRGPTIGSWIDASGPRCAALLAEPNTRKCRYAKPPPHWPNGLRVGLNCRAAVLRSTFPSLQKINGIVHIEFASSVGTIPYISVLPTILYMTTRTLALLAPLFFWGAIHAQNTVGLLTNEAEYSQDGYTLFYPADQHTVFLIDNCGRLVHT